MATINSLHAQFKDLAEIHKMLTSSLTPMAAFREQVNALREAQEAISSAMRPMRYFQDEISTLSKIALSPGFALSEIARGIPDLGALLKMSPFEALRHEMSTLQKAAKSLQESMLPTKYITELGNISGALKYLRQMSPIPKIDAQLAMATDLQKSLTSVWGRIPLGIADTLSLARHAHMLKGIDLNVLQSWVREAEEEGLGDIEHEVEEAKLFVEQSGIQHLPLEQRVQILWQKVHETKSPTLKIILIWLFLQFLGFFLQDVYTGVKNLVGDWLRSKQTVREVRRLVTETVGNEVVPKDARIVARPTLTVRSTYKRHAQVIAILSSGSVVRVLKKRKKWSLVEWQLGTVEMCRGWVRTKYLKSLLKRRSR